MKHEKKTQNTILKQLLDNSTCQQTNGHKLPVYLLIGSNQKGFKTNRDSRKSRQKMVKITAHFCENRKNHGKITAVYIAANLLKTHGFQLQKNIHFR